MALDATGTPTSLGIPKLNTTVDNPSGKGINAMMDAIDALLALRIAAPGSPSVGDTISWDGSDWVAAAASSGSPAGSVMAYAGGSAPSGWILCDGTSYPTATYPTLFAAIGYTYGGAGASFNVPDMRGRMAVGLGTHTDVDALGENDGAVLADRRPKHKHTVNQTPHTHSSPTSDGAGGSSGASDASSADGTTGGANANITIGPQTNSPTDAPAYLVLNYIIKT